MILDIGMIADTVPIEDLSPAKVFRDLTGNDNATYSEAHEVQRQEDCHTSSLGNLWVELSFSRFI
ncbi:hypothetical protein ACLOJK_009634 [Asimina triloba]